MEDGDQDLPCDFVATLIQQSRKKTDSKTVRERFLQCELAAPTIALKKFRMAADQCDNDDINTFAVCGVGSSKHYKESRPVMKGMVLGKMSNDMVGFWSKAARHLNSPDKKFGVLVLFEECEIQWQEVPWRPPDFRLPLPLFSNCQVSGCGVMRFVCLFPNCQVSD